MARGSEAKAQVQNTILDTFAGAFVNGKEIRIPLTEGGEPIEIKITLTAAKDLIGGVTAEIPAAGTVTEQSVFGEAPKTAAVTEMTQEEKDRIKSLADFGNLSELLGIK